MFVVIQYHYDDVDAVHGPFNSEKDAIAFFETHQHLIKSQGRQGFSIEKLSPIVSLEKEYQEALRRYNVVVANYLPSKAKLRLVEHLKEKLKDVGGLT